jgi:hypothetical protein
MTEPLRILALDLMTTTGWAISDSKGLILSGSQCFKPQRFEGGGMRYLRFARWLDEMLESGVDWVVFEEVRAHRGTDAAHIYGGFMAALTSRCEALYGGTGGHDQNPCDRQRQRPEKRSDSCNAGPRPPPGRRQ